MRAAGMHTGGKGGVLILVTINARQSAADTVCLQEVRLTRSAGPSHRWFVPGMASFEALHRGPATCDERRAPAFLTRVDGSKHRQQPEQSCVFARRSLLLVTGCARPGAGERGVLHGKRMSSMCKQVCSYGI